MAFVHLHNHTEYSLLDGQTKVKAMARRARDLGMDALAITDHGYMLGVPAFMEACKKEKVKPIVGCEIYFTPDETLSREKKPELYHLILLAKDLCGYHNLLNICSQAAADNFYYKPRVTLSMLERYGEGLIGTSACLAGIVPQMLLANRTEDAHEWTRRLAGAFATGDFYIELQDQGMLLPKSGSSQAELNRLLAQLAAEMNLKTVAANDIHYLHREDSKAQDYMLCIQTGSKVAEPNRMRFECDQFYMKTEAEMRAALVEYPQACDTTVEIAEKCNLELPTDYILPVVPLQEGETTESLLATNALAGLEERYGSPLPAEVLERYEYEYGVICSQGFPAYFLVVQEFVAWAKENGVGVGPGRGSAAGSIISYALGITDLDPLANGLMFERFLSLERVEMPDIDIDFDEEGRPRVIEHLRELYGTEKVAHVITYSTMKAKAAIKDAARILDKPIILGDRISKTIQGGPKADLRANLGEPPGDSDLSEEDARKQKSPDLLDIVAADPDAKEVVDAARALEGTIRGEGVHASAVIICRDPVVEHVPIKRDTKGGVIITQYDGTHSGKLGLLKMDFLGLKNLNILMRARENVRTFHGVDVNINEIPLDDPKVLEMLRRGETSGVFQVESPGMTGLLRQMNVDSYNDVVAAIALFRPGPNNAGMTRDYVERKAGRRQPEYYDERLKPILEETWGTIVYQEQVMRISMTMSGFTAGESDVVRKAVAKKIFKMMHEERDWQDGSHESMMEHWLGGAERNGYSRALAQRIWDDVEKFAEYAFNKSHSAAYAVLVMQTAWFKAYYPVEYMAAVLSTNLNKSDELIRYIAACTKMGIEVLPPCINSSGPEFTPLGNSVRFGLAGIRGVGAQAAELIIGEREARGPYTSLHDFAFRIPNTMVNKGAVEALIKSGAFDSTGYTRRQMFRFIDIDKLIDIAAKRRKEQTEGQVSLFDLLGDEAATEAGFGEDVPEPDGIEWERREKLAAEKEILRMYVSDHPLRPYAASLATAAEYTLGQLVADADAEAEADESEATANDIARVPQDRDITVAGMVATVEPILTKANKRMARFILEDLEGKVEVIVFPRQFERFGHLLVEDEVLKVCGEFEISARGPQFKASSLKTIRLSEGTERAPQPLELRFRAAQFNQEFSDRLLKLLKGYGGIDPVILILEREGTGPLRADLPFTVDSSDSRLRAQLATL